jgi:hypothetical protein
MEPDGLFLIAYGDASLAIIRQCPDFVVALALCAKGSSHTLDSITKPGPNRSPWCRGCLFLAKSRLTAA